MDRWTLREEELELVRLAELSHEEFFAEVFRDGEDPKQAVEAFWSAVDGEIVKAKDGFKG